MRSHFVGHGVRKGIPKRAFDTRADAEDYIATKPRGRFTTYRCSFCKKWHIASNYSEGPFS